jgi:hypothetical protein
MLQPSKRKRGLRTPKRISDSRQVNTMRYLVTLRLEPPGNSLQYVKRLPGFKDVEIDEAYGLVLISPKRQLYTIRVSGDLDAEQLMSKQPEVKGVHGDVKVSTFGPPQTDRR